ncbi:MAG: Gfo/Idh/MocA family oxidoreductase [Betaproteobacteria bacterium]|nr:Gfo/Idh/MocA family oxidoreductase [Betaproteobacteria bacterium]
MINAAIAGLGWWGKNIVNAVQDKSERLRFIRGVSKEPDTVRDFAAKHGLELSTELDDLLGDPRVQAVVLATPHSLHPGQVVAAAAAGKSVFCEKPLALKKPEAVRAVEACKQAGVVLGVGTNKRFWPSMRELKKVVAGGKLGEILHIEGHYSNENSGMHFSAWRDLPTESPGGGMTGAGLHILDALISLAGPVRCVHGRLVTRKPQPDPHDTVSVLFEFANGVSGMLGTVRATPFYWRVNVFGSKGSAEALGETDLVVRLSGAKPTTQSFEPVDALRAEFDAFADAVAGRAPYPIPTAQMVDTVAAFEAVIKSIESDDVVLLDKQ